jgi:hypothetical protein
MQRTAMALARMASNEDLMQRARRLGVIGRGGENVEEMYDPTEFKFWAAMCALLADSIPVYRRGETGVGAWRCVAGDRCF